MPAMIVLTLYNYRDEICGLQYDPLKILNGLVVGRGADCSD